MTTGKPSEVVNARLYRQKRPVAPIEIAVDAIKDVAFLSSLIGFTGGFLGKTPMGGLLFEMSNSVLIKKQCYFYKKLPMEYRTAKGVCVLAALLLAGCGDKPPQPDSAAIAAATSLQPSDPALAAIYERSCRTCHSQLEAKAPLTGFTPHWAARMAQGMPTLLAHVRDGFQGMPARGYCNDCSDTEYEALIRFMAGK